DSTMADELVRVSTEDAYDTMKGLLKKEGIFVGHSSGAVAYAALECAKTLEEGVIVTVFPDGGYRYLSGGIWW
ncbi:MAG: pyridoxal-phosphate dependent enzyme, partial [Candidatus Dadabacteria bacterium]|nr:pyridoxal-phosphate dependent enzyme [Candidatus Dadabacteria bacterium]